MDHSTATGRNSFGKTGQKIAPKEKSNVSV
jgi:hypothetical protein